MKILINEDMMRFLSFPDDDVEKMDFSPSDKRLKIYVEGAWLDANGGHVLGKGVLYFQNWQDLSIRVYNSTAERWITLDHEEFEPLKDICEAKFTDSHVQLGGFGKNVGIWVEWNIHNPRMHGEFEDCEASE